MDKIGFKSDLVSKLLGKSNEVQVKKPAGAVKVMGTEVGLFVTKLQTSGTARGEPSLNAAPRYESKPFDLLL